MSEPINTPDFAEIVGLIDAARQQAYRAVNTTLFERMVLNPVKVSPLVTLTLRRHSRVLLSGIQRVYYSIKLRVNNGQCNWIPAIRGMTAKRMIA